MDTPVGGPAVTRDQHHAAGRHAHCAALAILATGAAGAIDTVSDVGDLRILFRRDATLRAIRPPYGYQWHNGPGGLRNQAGTDDGLMLLWCLFGAYLVLFDKLPYILFCVLCAASCTRSPPRSTSLPKPFMVLQPDRVIVNSIAMVK